MKKLIIALTIALSAAASASASGDITVKYNGTALAFNQDPVIVKDKTLVQLRPIAEALGLSIDFSSQKGSVILSDNKTTVVFTENSDKITVNGVTTRMDVPVAVRNDYTFVPVRSLAEPFVDEITFDGVTQTVSLTKSPEENPNKGAAAAALEAAKQVGLQYAAAAEKGKENPQTGDNADKPAISTGTGSATYFYQSQPDLALENKGRGYCWVCAYAMLMSDVKGELITPIDVAKINIARGYSGSFMSGHETLVAEFGCTLIPALAEDSAYYAGFNAKNKGETALKITSDEDAKNALKEALDRNPKGVIARFEGYPHSMTAVAYDSDNIYFNDPGLAGAEHVTLDKTCLKGYKLSDVSYIQAIAVK